MTGKNERRYTVYGTIEREGEYRIERELAHFADYWEAYEYGADFAEKTEKGDFERVQLFDEELREWVVLWEL